MARTSSKRTDSHRPGAIIPAHYAPVLSFSLSSMENGWPVPSHGINCVLDGRRDELGPDGKPTGKTIPGEHGTGPCCVVHLRELGERFARDGGPGKCDVCGALYVHGDVWRHMPTGELIFVGHDCAAKYEMLVDRSEWELSMGRLRRAAAVECEKARRAEARTAFYEPRRRLVGGAAPARAARARPDGRHPHARRSSHDGAPRRVSRRERALAAARRRRDLFESG